MAKIPESVVKIVDVASGLGFSFKSTVSPKESTLGCSDFGTLNSRGRAKCQAKGVMVLDETTYCQAIINAFRIAYGVELVMDEDIGNRGPNWQTPEQRAKFKVFVNDVEYNPAISAATLKRLEAEEAKEKAKALVSPVTIAPVAVAVADTTVKTIDKAKVLENIKKNADKFPKDAIIGQLTTRMSLAEAEQLYKEATTPVVQKIEIPKLW